MPNKQDYRELNSILYDLIKIDSKTGDEYILIEDLEKLELSSDKILEVKELLDENGIALKYKQETLKSNRKRFANNSFIKFPKPLSKEETANLFRKYQENKTADIRNKIIEGNLRLVPKVCFKYKFTRVDFNEIISIGFEGLIRSVDKFDPSYGNSFSTYAYSSIEKTIITNLPKLEGFKNSKEYFDYIHTRNLVLSYYEDSDDMIPENIYQDIISLLEKTGKYERCELDELICRIGAINYTNFDDLEELLVDNSSLERYVTLSLLKESLKKSIENLPEREQLVLTKHNGLNDEMCHTFKEISLLVGVSSSRCCQIEKESRVYLSSQRRIRNPKDYYDYLQNIPSEPLEGTNKVLIK